MGVQKGDRVAYIAPNTHSHLEAYYAVPQIGAVLVPINYRLKSDEFEYILNHCGAKVLCVHPDFYDAIDSIRGQIKTVEAFIGLEDALPDWIDYEAQIHQHDASFEPVEIDELDLITINYTSGTTARPKGVMITHRNAYINIMGTLAHHHLTPQDRYLWTLPMFHANGWTFTWINTARGMTHVCLRKVEPAVIYDLIIREEITMFCAAPTVLIGIANAPEEIRRTAPRGVRLFTAGAPPAAATIELVEKDLGWELTHVYGLTETAPLITVCEPRDAHAKLSIEERSKVKARQGVELVSSGEVRVVDENGDEVSADGKTLGEITVRGNVVMAGYYNDINATEAAIRDGWFYTGDIGTWGENGELVIVGHGGETANINGLNVNLVLMDAVISSMPGVTAAAVFKNPRPSASEELIAFVATEPDADKNTIINEARTLCLANFGRHATPARIIPIDEIPVNLDGTPDRRACIEIVKARQGAHI